MRIQRPTVAQISVEKLLQSRKYYSIGLTIRGFIFHVSEQEYVDADI
jgi:hypothetical protein